MEVRVGLFVQKDDAFNTLLGHFQYLVLLFELTNTLVVLQALVNGIRHNILNRFVFVYIDDILIFSEMEKEHIQHVHLVLHPLLENRLFVKGQLWTGDTGWNVPSSCLWCGPPIRV